MIAFPNAKINLGLRVLSKRNDGYHNIETIFYPVKWRDALEAIKVDYSSEFKLTVTGLDVDGDLNNNFCAKAWKLMHDKYRIPAVHIHLHKVIPFGAGLGGGSSDAAFTLKLLNKLFELKLDDSDLELTSSEIGSDCAFFIKNKPVLARGRGNDFTEVNIDLTSFKIVIVKPEINVNTAQAYENIIPEKNNDLDEVIKLRSEYWKDKLINDFEKNIFKKYPEIEKIKNKLYYYGATYSSMSGSGSAVYGLFKKEIKMNEIKFDKCKVWAGEL